LHFRTLEHAVTIYNARVGSFCAFRWLAGQHKGHPTWKT